MPRDAHSAAKAVEMLDMLLEFFGEDGRRWLTCNFHDEHGNRCLTAAMTHLRAVMKFRAAIPPGNISRKRVTRDALACVPRLGWSAVRWNRLVDLNDYCPSYDQLREVIVRAREIALGDIGQPEQTAYAGPRNDDSRFGSGATRRPSRKLSPTGTGIGRAALCIIH